jgi:uncharacterized protein YcfJ
VQVRDSAELGIIRGFGGRTMKLPMKTLAVILATTFGTVPFADESFAAGKNYCKSYARKEANRRTGMQRVAGGAAAGAVLGGVLGAIVDGGRGLVRGAAVGAVGGTVVGGVRTNKKWRRVYDQAYARCRSW